MTIKHRLIKLEAASRMLWLVMQIKERPSLAQFAEIDRAHKSGRCVIVFVEQGDTCWTNRSSQKPPWDETGE